MVTKSSLQGKGGGGNLHAVAKSASYIQTVWPIKLVLEYLFFKYGITFQNLLSHPYQSPVIDHVLW